MNEERFAAALDECARRCLGSDRPFYELSQLLESYRTNPAWTTAEVIELQTRVIRMLMGQWKGPDGKASDTDSEGA
jgi:hypothetical protein